MFQPHLYRCCALVAVLTMLASLVSARSAIAEEPQYATVLVLMDRSYTDADLAWFADEAVGILLDGNDLGGGADAKSCDVLGFEGSYRLTDATLVTKHGGRMPSRVYVKLEPGVLLPAHGFLPVVHFQDVTFFRLSDTANTLSEDAYYGGYAGFFVTVGL